MHWLSDRRSIIAGLLDAEYAAVDRLRDAYVYELEATVNGGGSRCG